MPKLIVLAAFDRNEDTGELVPAFEARQMPDEDRAKRAAREMKDEHAGVIAWSREANPDEGEFGPPEILAAYGDVPDMD